MPNVRPSFVMTHDSHEFRITPRLKGMRSHRLLMWIPYITGQAAGISVVVEPIGQPYPQALICEVRSDIEMRSMGQVASAQLKGNADPVFLDSGLEYISAPDDYRWEIELGSREKETLGDFSAFSRDRFAVTLLIASVALFFAAANLTAGIIALFD